MLTFCFGGTNLGPAGNLIVALRHFLLLVVFAKKLQSLSVNSVFDGSDVVDFNPRSPEVAQPEFATNFTKNGAAIYMCRWTRCRVAL